MDNNHDDADAASAQPQPSETTIERLEAICEALKDAIRRANETAADLEAQIARSRRRP
jgi:prefoldin subunit 5